MTQQTLYSTVSGRLTAHVPATLTRRAALICATAVVFILTVQPAWAVIVFLKGQDEPLRGYLLSSDDHKVVINELLPDNAVKKRTILRAEIDDVLQTVSFERLESLKPAEPDRYREYAEELAEKSKDPDARVTAIRLFLIAAHLAPERLGRSCLLGMVPLAENDAQQRQFRAMAYLLDATHDPKLLTMPVLSNSPHSDMEPRYGKQLLRVLRKLRQGNRREAASLARRIRLKDRLRELTDTITYEEFDEACSTVCPHCVQGYQKCPACGGRKFVAGESCPTCSARGTIACPHCGTDYRHNPLPPSLLKRIVQLELNWLPSTTPLPNATSPPHRSWAQSVQQGRVAPLPPLSLETITEFDPRENVFRDGQWTS